MKFLVDHTYLFEDLEPRIYDIPWFKILLPFGTKKLSDTQMQFIIDSFREEIDKYLEI